VRVGDDGQLFEIDGRPVAGPCLPPARILKAVEDVRAGRYRPLSEILAERKAHGL
jgi:hypothetical protein